MFASKRVIVVYPESYEGLALSLQHEISKVDGFDSAAWPLKHYDQNMPTLSGRSYVIFIGDSEENRFSKMYLSQIIKIVNINGACYGRDGSKAVVFGEGKLEQKETFEVSQSKLEYDKTTVENIGSAVKTIGVQVADAFLLSVPLVPLAVGGVLCGIGYQVIKHFMSKTAAKELRYEQTKLAIYNFILTELDVWVRNEG
jgi:hypothetical protein